MDDLRLPCGAVAYLEAHARLNLMHALATGGSGVNVQHILQIADALYPKDVAVAADENVGRIRLQNGSDAAIPSSRPAADVRNPESKSFELEPLMLEGSHAHGAPVDIAPDSRNGCELLELVQDVRRTDVSGVKDHVRVTEEIRNGGMEK